MNNLYILGSGMSLNDFDVSQIQRKDIVFAINSSICVYPQADFLFISDWYAIHNRIFQFKSLNTQLVVRYDLGTQGIKSDFFIKQVATPSQNLSYFNSNFLRHSPEIVKCQFDIEILKNPNKIEELNIVPSSACSGSLAFAYAYRFIKQKEIKKIIYVGLDSCILKRVSANRVYEKQYSHKIKSALETELHSFILEPTDWMERYQVLPSIYDYSLFTMLLLTSLSRDFYNILESQSWVDIKKIPFEYLEKIQQIVLKNCKEKIELYEYRDALQNNLNLKFGYRKYL